MGVNPNKNRKLKNGTVKNGKVKAGINIDGEGGYEKTEQRDLNILGSEWEGIFNFVEL